MMDNRVEEERDYRRCWRQPCWKANTWRTWGAIWLGPEGSRGKEHPAKAPGESAPGVSRWPSTTCQGLTQMPLTLIPPIRAAIPQLCLQTSLQAVCAGDLPFWRQTRVTGEEELGGTRGSGNYNQNILYAKNLSSVKNDSFVLTILSI